MDYNKKEIILIGKLLLEKGIFAISDIEKESKMSREGIGKILKKLVNQNILKKTQKRGAYVKYKLANKKEGLKFIFNYKEKLLIVDFERVWNVSKITAKKNIKKFVDIGLVKKIGRPPQKIIYQLNPKDEYNFTPEQREIIEKYYSYLTPAGEFLQGIEGFIYWFKNKSQRTDILKLAEEYLETRKKIYQDKKNVFLINATKKIKTIFKKDPYLAKLFHRDFDSIPVFGKTYLGQIIRIVKSGKTNTKLMNEIVDKIQDSVDEIAKEYEIDAIGFIPPTVMRKTQIMDFIKKKLKFPGKVLKVYKAQNLVAVQQKSLKKIEDRILNADKTIIIDDTGEKYKNILLIDDVTGSGATLNETAKKIIEKGLAEKVYGFTIVGSAKAGVFEVISET